MLLAQFVVYRGRLMKLYLCNYVNQFENNMYVTYSIECVVPIILNRNKIIQISEGICFRGLIAF